MRIKTTVLRVGCLLTWLLGVGHILASPNPATKVATEKLEGRHPLELFEQAYSVSGDLAKAKDHVTVGFQAHPGNTAGGVFGVRLMRPE